MIKGLFEKIITVFKELFARKKLLVIVIIVIVGIIYWVMKVRGNGKDFEIANVERGTVKEELILTGSITADEYADLTFSSSGKISWIGVSEGDWVKKGQALAKIDTTNLNADLQRARSDYRSAQATVEKVHDEVKDNDDDETFEQKEDRTVAEVALDKAWDALLKAQYNLDNATLYAPFEGMITYVANPYSGVNALYTATQFEIINPETIYFDVSADQSEVVDIKEGQKVAVVLDSFSEEEIEGEIVFISLAPKSGEAGAVYKVKIGFPGEIDTGRLRIGMTGDARFVLREKEDVLYAPADFVNTDTKGKYINLSSKNNKVYIDVGIEGEERVEIIGDIKEGDTLYD